MGNLTVSAQQMKETRESYKQCIATWGSLNLDPNILYFLTVSRTTEKNLLQNLVDSYRRWAVDRMLQNQDCYVKDWIKDSQFLRNLENKLKKVVITGASSHAELDFFFFGERKISL